MAADRTEFTPIVWVNDVTALNQSNLNHLEQGVYKNSLLSRENAILLDEIYDAFITKLNLIFDSDSDSLTLSIGEENNELATKWKKILSVTIDTHKTQIENLDTLLNEKQDIIDATNKLSADLVDDTNTTNKFVTAADKVNWNGKQDALVSGTNIKTINGQNILGSGNIDIQTDYQEGFGIDIANDTISVDTDVITTKEEFNALKLLVEEAIVDTSKYQFNYWDIDNVPITINSYPTLVSAGLDIKALRGRSVAFNQLFYPKASATASGVEITNNGDGSLTLNGTATSDNYFNITDNANYPINFIQSHKYLLRGGNTNVEISAGASSITSEWVSTTPKIFESNSTASSYIRVHIVNGTTYNNVKIVPQIFDLALFPLDITSVLEFNRLFPQSYYEYNAGTMLSSKASALDVVGYNQFDGEWQLKIINPGTGDETDSDRGLSSVNFIKVIPGQSYTLEDGNISGYVYKYFDYYDKDKNFISSVNTSSTGAMTKTIPDNACYVKIYYLKPSGQSWTIPTNSKATFHLTLTGAKIISDVYNKHTYALPNIDLKSAGTAYDELKPDGKLITRIAVIDLGTLDWIYSGVYFVCESDIGNARPSSASVAFNGLCTKYTVVPQSNSSDKTIKAVPSSGHLIVHDSSYTDATTFKTAMSGVYLYFEDATPTETQTEYTYIDSIESLQDGATLSQTSSVGLGYVIDTEMAIYKPKGE